MKIIKVRKVTEEIVEGVYPLKVGSLYRTVNGSIVRSVPCGGGPGVLRQQGSRRRQHPQPERKRMKTPIPGYKFVHTPEIIACGHIDNVERDEDAVWVECADEGCDLCLDCWQKISEVVTDEKNGQHTTSLTVAQLKEACSKL